MLINDLTFGLQLSIGIIELLVSMVIILLAINEFPPFYMALDNACMGHFMMDEMVTTMELVPTCLTAIRKIPRLDTFFDAICIGCNGINDAV